MPDSITKLPTKQPAPVVQFGSPGFADLSCTECGGSKATLEKVYTCVNCGGKTWDAKK